VTRFDRTDRDYRYRLEDRPAPPERAQFSGPCDVWVETDEGEVVATGRAAAIDYTPGDTGEMVEIGRGVSVARAGFPHASIRGLRLARAEYAKALAAPELAFLVVRLGGRIEMRGARLTRLERKRDLVDLDFDAHVGRVLEG